MLNDYDLDVLCVVETWLNSQICSDELFINHYQIFRLDRTKNKGGGIIIFVKNNSIVHLENTYISNYMELIHISVKIGNNSFINIISFYRCPNLNIKHFTEEISDFLNNIAFNALPLILLGDINYDFLNLSKSSDPILHTFNSYSIKNLIKIPTRITHNTSSCIDWILSNSLAKDNISDIKSHSVGFSDHNFLHFSFKAKRNIKFPTAFKESLIISTESLNMFNEKLVFINHWTLDQLITNTKELVNKNFKTFKRLVPTVEDYDLNWISNKFLTFKTLRDKALKSYKYSRSLESHLRYQKYKKLCDKQAKIDKKITSQI